MAHVWRSNNGLERTDGRYSARAKAVYLRNSAGLFGDTMTGLPLLRRKQLLNELGHTALASRSFWSHDLGDSIAFDAWEHHWLRNAKGDLLKYPLRTNGRHYNLENAKRNPRRGHTRWQTHVDLVLAGKRRVLALVPVANDPKANPNRGAKGWLPLHVDGHVKVDSEGQVWFLTDRIVPV